MGDPTASAIAAALLVAAAATGGAGYWSEHSVAAPSGVLVTLCVSAVATNVARWAPGRHPLYDWCCSTLLPASMALLLVSLHHRQSRGINDTDGTGYAIGTTIGVDLYRVLISTL